MDGSTQGRFHNEMEVLRNQLTQSCYEGLGCERLKRGLCRRIHGEVDPRQQEYYKKHVNACMNGKWGHAVCKHYLGGRECPRREKCQYRHFKEDTMIPWTEEQREALSD